jgi:hypothetical protein
MVSEGTSSCGVDHDIDPMVTINDQSHTRLDRSITSDIEFDDVNEISDSSCT